MECSSASCRSSRPPNSDASRLPSRNISAGDLRLRTSDVSGHREGRGQKRPHHPSIQPRPEDRHRVTDVSRIRGTMEGHRRTPADTTSLEITQEDPGGHGGTWEDIGRVRDGGAPGSNPGPPTKNRIQNRRFAGSAYPAVSQGRSQIFREVGGGSLRLSGLLEAEVLPRPRLRGRTR
jgi:hypothetical protein